MFKVSKHNETVNKEWLGIENEDREVDRDRLVMTSEYLGRSGVSRGVVLVTVLVPWM